MGRAPLLALGAAAAAGAVLAEPLDPWLRAAIGAAVLVIVRLRPLAASALVAGVFAATIAFARTPQPAREHTVRVACTMVAVNACTVDEGPTLAVTLAQPPPLAAHVLLRGRLQPFDGPRNPGEPDMAAIERERGVDAELAGARVLRTLQPAPRSPPAALARAHAWALAQLRTHVDEPYASVLAGELWGEKASLAPELRTEFQETGTVHILVTAGLHLGVVAFASMLFLRALRLPRIAVVAVALLLVWSYAIFSGLHLPSVRAATMISFGLAAFACGRAPMSWNAYGAALLAFALFRPQSIASASFALSFSCVGAILLLGKRIERAMDSFAVHHRVKEAITLAAATQIGTWPLTASIFLLFAPYAMLANVLVVPVVGLTMLIAGVQFAASAFPLAAQAAATIDTWLLSWIVSVITTISSLPYAAVPMAPAPPLAIAAYDASLLFATWAWTRGGRTIACACVLLTVLFIALPPLHSETRLKIVVLDVGQADAIVIQTPLGHTLLVDAGGRIERGGTDQSPAEQVGEKVVVPYLRRAGIRHIDAMLLSHPHGDHAGGVAPVLRNYGGADLLGDSGQRYGGYAYNDALDVAHSEAVPIRMPRAGDVWRYDDGVVLRFIGPSLPYIQSNNTINDNSIAFTLQYRHFRMLFTGDAGVAAEQRFLSEGIDLHADVLKVGHHGSAYSSSPAFIAAVHPRYAIISVGRHNMFGHPAPSTIQTLQRFGVNVYRTDKNGAVTIMSDGVSIRINSVL